MKNPKSLIIGAFAATISFASAANILVSALDTSEIEAFLAANYSDANVTAAGDFSNFNAASTQSALNGVDLVIIGRSLSSSAYANGNADGYNGLEIPVLNFTSYTARNAGNRMGWHTGSATNNKSVAGNETTITAAGSNLLGVPLELTTYSIPTLAETSMVSAPEPQVWVVEMSLLLSVGIS